MKKQCALIMAVVILFSLSASARAWTVSVDDSNGSSVAYWGGRVQNASPAAYGDVIGAEFAVDFFALVSSGGIVTATMTGPYFYNHLNNVGQAGSYGPGYLFLGQNWMPPAGTEPHYATDTYNTAQWQWYVSPTGVYTYNDAGRVLTTAPSGDIWRANQLFQCEGGAKVSDVLLYTLTETSLTFIFMDPGVDPDNYVARWASKCGNEVLNLGSPVPVPPTALLFGSGLLGLGLLGFRRKKKN